MIEWKDETSYSRSDAERVPRAWVAEAGGLKVSVHRHIHHAPDAWLLTCRPWFECHDLPSKAAPMAKSGGLPLVIGRVIGPARGLFRP